MIKRIIILSFCFLFLVSTTGLPLTIHFCKMTKKTYVNKSCSMCGMDNCANKTSNDVSIKRAMGSCCHTSTFDNNIKDNFLAFNTDFNFHSLSIIMVLQVECPVNLYTNTISFNDTSPPPLLNNNLYLFNSIFLI
jgi:hypothetical protein